MASEDDRPDDELISRPAGELVRMIHAAGRQAVLALNGGSRALAELLEVPGGSRTLLEAVVPYSEAALVYWLGGKPDQFCSARTASAMAVAAFGRALRLGAAEGTAVGIAASASLASDRPKRGSHRAHVALQMADRTACWSLELQKGERTREQEEQIVSRMVLRALAEACGLDARLELPLFADEHVETESIIAPPSWQDLFMGRREAIRAGRDDTAASTDARRVIFPGAFNPLHVGHRRMAEIAAETLGRPVEFEISIANVDKPALDYLEIARRLAQFAPQQAVWLTRAATFEEKSRAFPGAVFVVGSDTLLRIVDPRYYGGDSARMLAAVERLIEREHRFLVFGRALEGGFVRLADIDLPERFYRLCTEIPPEQFRVDVASTALRRISKPEA